MTLSIIATIKDTPPFLEEFYTRVSTAAWILAGDDYEIILAQIGAKTSGKSDIALLNQADSHLRMAAIQPGASKAAAFMAALPEAKGERIFLIDVNPGEEPEWLLAFSAALEEGGLDFVYGVQEPIRSSGFRQLFYNIAQFFGGWLGRKENNPLQAALMTRSLKEALLSANDAGLLAQKPLPFPEYRQQSFSVIINPLENQASPE